MRINYKKVVAPINIMEPEITEVPFGKGASGSNILEPTKDKGYIQHIINGQFSAIPTSIYCPSCSDVLEVDRYKKVKRKFIINPNDLVFDLSYMDDEGEMYAKCNVCNFDLRKEPHSFNDSEKIKEEKLEPIKRQHIIESVKYRNSKFFIPKDEFIKLAKMYIQGDRVEICIRQKIGYETYTYIAKEDVFENPKSLVYENNEVGINRNYWKQK